MKHIVRKAYWDFEREEKWLNEMSAKGSALTDYKWCKYIFEEAPQNEYVYRIEFLDHLINHPESVKYLAFLEENGIEVVASYTRWVYLRQKASEGTFELHTDRESRIKHYKRINNFWNSMGLLEITLCAIQLPLLIVRTGVIYNVLLVFFCLLGVIGLIFLSFGSKVRKKIKVLEQENLIRE